MMNTLSNALTAVGWRVWMGWILIRTYVFNEPCKVLYNKD